MTDKIMPRPDRLFKQEVLNKKIQFALSTREYLELEILAKKHNTIIPELIRTSLEAYTGQKIFRARCVSKFYSREKYLEEKYA